MDPQISLFNNFFIKNGSHSTIHTFKNYFATVFSIFSFNKISSIQTDPYCVQMKCQCDDSLPTKETSGVYKILKFDVMTQQKCL